MAIDEEVFLELMADILEVDREEISVQTDFRTVYTFDSLVGFMMITKIEKDYGVTIEVDDFIATPTLGGLMERINAQGPTK